MRSDRRLTRVLAEASLERAQPLLALFGPQLVEAALPAALARSGLALVPDTPFDAVAWPVMRGELGAAQGGVRQWLDIFAADDASCPATAWWQSVFPDLRAAAAPAFGADELTRAWSAFVTALTGRPLTPADREHPFVASIDSDARFAERFDATLDLQREQPLSVADRGLYARFGWNDRGAMPGMAAMRQGLALHRIRRAWVAAAPSFDARARAIIEDAAWRVASEEAAAAREEAGATIEQDAARYGVSEQEMLDTFYRPPDRPPPLDRIASE